MIRLEIRGITVVLKDGSIPFEAENPLFRTDALPGIIALPFEVVKTPESQQAFKYWELIAVRDPDDDFIEGCKLYYNDTRFYVGVVKILNYVDGSYKISFNSGLANLKVVSLKSLRDLDYGGERVFPVKVDDSAADCLTKDITETDFQFPTFRNPSLYHGYPFKLSADPVNYEYFNYYNDGAYRRNAPSLPYRYAGYVPFPYLIYVVRQVFEAAKTEVSGSFPSDPEIQTAILYNTRVLDKPSGTITPGVTDIPDYADSLDLKNHVPDMKISEFLNAIKDLWNVKYFWNTFSNKVYMDSFKSIFENAKYVDWTEKVVGAYHVEAKENSGINLAYTDEGNDENKPDQVNSSIVFGQDGENITTAATLLQMSNEPDDFLGAKSWLIPHPDQPGNSNAYEAPPGELYTAPFGMRVLFYRGLQLDSNGDPYPMASTGDIDYSGTPIPGTNYTLNWNGAKGLYNVWWKDYIEFISKTRQVTFKVRLSLEDLLKLDMRTKVRIGNSLFFIKVVKFEIGNAISPADVDMYLI